MQLNNVFQEMYYVNNGDPFYHNKNNQKVVEEQAVWCGHKLFY